MRTQLRLARSGPIRTLRAVQTDVRICCDSKHWRRGTVKGRRSLCVRSSGSCEKHRRVRGPRDGSMRGYLPSRIPGFILSDAVHNGGAPDGSVTDLKLRML
jgi:hypothetical protein